MTQALQLLETRWEGVGPDMLLTGYLPASGGLHALHSELLGSPQPSAAAPASSANGVAPSASSPSRRTPAAAAGGAVDGANSLMSPAAYPLPLLRTSRRRMSSSQVRSSLQSTLGVRAKPHIWIARFSLALYLDRGAIQQPLNLGFAEKAG